MRELIIEETRKWIDTPYHHKARVCGVGVDCAMLVLAIGYRVGLVTKEQFDNPPDYSVHWHLHNNKELLIEILNNYGCIEIPIMEAQAGDILTFKYGRTTSHLGILINESQIVHARMDAGKVVVNTLNGELLERLTHAYRFPGVDNE